MASPNARCSMTDTQLTVHLPDYATVVAGGATDSDYGKTLDDYCSGARATAEDDGLTFEIAHPGYAPQRIPLLADIEMTQTPHRSLTLFRRWGGVRVTSNSFRGPGTRWSHALISKCPVGSKLT